MKQEDYFALTGSIREEYIAEAFDRQRRDANITTGEGSVRIMKHDNSNREVIREDKRARRMAVGGVAAAAAFALTVGVITHSAGNLREQSQTAAAPSTAEMVVTDYNAPENTTVTEPAAELNAFGGKGTLRFLNANGTLAEDDGAYYSPCWGDDYADKSAVNADGSLNIVHRGYSSYDTTQSPFSPYYAMYQGSMLYYHFDEGKTQIYAQDADGNEYQPFAAQLAELQKFYASEYGCPYLYLNSVKQTGDTERYFLSLFVGKDANVLTPFDYDKQEDLPEMYCAYATIFGKQVDRSDITRLVLPYGWDMVYDPVLQETVFYLVNGEYGRISAMTREFYSDSAAAQEIARITAGSAPTDKTDRILALDIDLTKNAAPQLYNGRLYYINSAGAFCEYDQVTETERVLGTDYRFFVIRGGKLYAVTADRNLVCADPDGSNAQVIYDGGDINSIAAQSAEDCVIVYLEHSGTQATLNNDTMFIFADGKTLRCNAK